MLARLSGGARSCGMPARHSGLRLGSEPTVASRWSGSELRDRVATLAAVESWLFAELGGTTRTASDPALEILLDVHARHHAWHAELLGAQLELLPPAEAGRAADGSARAAGDVGTPAGGGGARAVSELLASLAALLAGLPDEQVDLGCLAMAYRVVVPRLVAAYAEQLEGASPVADAPVLRATELVQTDELRHWVAGERAVQSLLVSAVVVGETASLVGRAEACLVGAGGLFGGPPPPAGGP